MANQSTEAPHPERPSGPPQPAGQPPRSGQFAKPPKGTHTTAPPLDPNKHGTATVRDNAHYADDPERPFEPRNVGMTAADWPRGPGDPAVYINPEAGSQPDSNRRGIGLWGGQREQPDQSGIDPDEEKPNPGWDMLRARLEAEKAGEVKKSA